MLDLKGYGPSILEGAVLTVEAALAGLLLATFFGLLGALAKLAPAAPLRLLAGAYTTLIRGVPDLVLMLLVFFGGQMLVNDLSARMGWEHVDVGPFTAGVLTLGFIYGAYMAETFRGAILAVPKGQLEAGRAFGMSPLLLFRRILLPQMLRHALPGFGNNWLVLLKATALLSVIGLDDMVRKAALAAGATRQPFTFYFAVALVFLALTSVSSLLLALAERWARRGEARPA